MADVIGIQLPPDAGAEEEAFIPGAYLFAMDEGRPVELIYRCPCGCGAARRVPFESPAYKGGSVWDWDGEVEKPTIRQALWAYKHLGGCGWHGWLRSGVFVEAPMAR